jgi:hypothetical protein
VDDGVESIGKRISPHQISTAPTQARAALPAATPRDRGHGETLLREPVRDKATNEPARAGHNHMQGHYTLMSPAGF